MPLTNRVAWIALPNFLGRYVVSLRLMLFTQQAIQAPECGRVGFCFHPFLNSLNNLTAGTSATQLFVPVCDLVDQIVAAHHCISPVLVEPYFLIGTPLRGCKRNWLSIARQNPAAE